MQAIQRLRRQAKVLGQALLARILIAPGTERPDVEGPGSQRFHQRHVVELGVVRERNDGRVRVRHERLHSVIGHPGDARDAFNVQGRRIFVARVTDQTSKSSNCIIWATAWLSWPAPISSKRQRGPK